MKKVTVIMPAYNHENFIGFSIESVLEQTYKNIEFLILNDGSTDGTKSVIESYAKVNPQIRLIDKPNNEGTVEALNDLIEEASGEYIIWLSSDDLQYPYTIEKFMARLNQSPEHNVAIAGWIGIDKNGNMMKEYPLNSTDDKYYFHKRMLIWNVLSGCSVIVKKECFKSVGRFDARFRYAHDVHMFFRIFAENDVLSIIEPLAKNRVHEGQITAYGKNHIDVVRIMFDLYQNKTVMESYLTRIGMKYNDETMVFLIRQFGAFVANEEMQERKEFIYRLNKYIKNNKLSKELEYILLDEKKFFEQLTDEELTKQLKIKKEDIDEAFKKLAEKYELDGVLINKEAVRYHLIDERKAASFYEKVMPHDNMLCTAQIRREDLDYLKEELLFFENVKDEKDVYKIGLTGYMAEKAPYKDKFCNSEVNTTVMLSYGIYRILIEKERIKSITHD